MSKLFNLRLSPEDRAALADLSPRLGKDASAVVRALIHAATTPGEAERRLLTVPGPVATVGGVTVVDRDAVRAKPKATAEQYGARLDKGYAAKGGRMK